MGLARAMQRRRRMKFEELFERRQAGQLSQEDAARVLGVSVRAFRRWEGRYGAEGGDGLLDRRLDRVAGNRIPADTVAEVLELYDTMYECIAAIEGYIEHHNANTVRSAGAGSRPRRGLEERPPEA